MALPAARRVFRPAAEGGAPQQHPDLFSWFSIYQEFIRSFFVPLIAAGSRSQCPATPHGPHRVSRQPPMRDQARRAR
ncbi:hypothetical protein NDU88_000456 [Pleurodeles waltl]|uniref:Uncharacterized protein n=1 Tax=Pleurodeles waltl TaxID=8319 RepID=A0AAV7P8C2_PLEWA|nr:hypothetical protein NDU88_000456 [Pleurodeles waltl]